jgi:hypothetical protein
MLSRRALMLTGSAGAIAGCGDVGNVSGREAFTNTNLDAVFIMRVRTPDDLRIGLAIPPFDRVSGRSRFPSIGHEYSVVPECGDAGTRSPGGGCRPWYSTYIVDRVAPGDYHFQGVERIRGTITTLGAVDPGRGFPKRFAFTVVPGRVNYLGDFLLEFGGNSFRLVNAEAGIERAQAYLRRRYPRITADIVANFPAPRTGPA